MTPDLIVGVNTTDLEQIGILVRTREADGDMSPIPKTHTGTKELRRISFECGGDISGCGLGGSEAGEESG